jgi:hypothetical protein
MCSKSVTLPWSMRWYFFRKELWYMLPLWYRNLWDEHIRPFFRPQHSELRAAIPKRWMDITEIIPEILYACVISYVEKEDGINLWEIQDEGHGCKIAAPMLREVYQWAKKGRAEFQEKIMAAYPPLPEAKEWTRLAEHLNKHDPERDAAYAKVDQLETQFDDIDTKYLVWIVTHRDGFWS